MYNVTGTVSGIFTHAHFITAEYYFLVKVEMKKLYSKPS